METIKAINERYTELSESSCCLSCGGAINYSDAREGEVFLDLGSGRGTDAIRLAQELGRNGKVYGLDISDGMISKAKKTAAKMAIDNVEFIQSELETIPLPEQTVNCVISNCTINHAKDKLQVWKEIYRVLKKGGRFVVSDIFSSQPVPPEYANDPEAVAECWAGSVTKEVYMATLNQAGFSDIEIIEESAPYDKGKIKVSSFTIKGKRPAGCCGNK